MFKDMKLVYIITDGCSGKQSVKNQYTSFCGWDHKAGFPRVIFVEAHALPKGGGAKIAEAVQADLNRFFITMVGGSATDNASDVRITFVREMQKKFPLFIPMGCHLHIFNLLMTVPIQAAFGKASMGVCSALRLAYTIPYLMKHFPDSWMVFCSENYAGEDVYLFVEASAGRWWSIQVSYDDIYVNKDKVLGWLIHQCNALTAYGPDQRTNSTYQPIFVEAKDWLQSPKVYCSV